jgi:hypothetical protein
MESENLGVNPYRFVNNNPLSWVDPTGMQVIPMTPCDKGDPVIVDEWINPSSGCTYRGYYACRENQYASGNWWYQLVSGPHIRCPLDAIPTEDEISFLPYRPSASAGMSNVNALTDQSTGTYLLGIGLTGAGVASGIGEYSNEAAGYWRGINNKWYSTGWGGNQYTGGRSLVLKKAGIFRLAGRGVFGVSAGLSLVQAGTGTISKTKAAVDIGFGAISTFGGIPGLAVGTGYFVLDALDAFNPGTPVTPPNVPFGVPDITRVNY